MSELIGEALVEGIRVFGRTRTEEARYNYLAGKNGAVAALPSATPKSEELTLPDVELNNYVKRSEVGEEGEHVLVVEHKERIEKKHVPTPPPTPEEIEAERQQKRYLAKVWGVVASVAITVAGIVIVVERRSPPKPTPPRLEVV